MRLFDRAINIGDGARLKTATKVAAAVRDRIPGLADADLAEEHQKLVTAVAGNVDNITGATLEQALAVAAVAAERHVGLAAYDTQLTAAAAAAAGHVVEMKTGEGKSLVAVLAAYAESLATAGVHVITVNDYLAARDARHATRILGPLGVSVSAVVDDDGQVTRRFGYAADITYVTHSTVGFDLLRDNLVVDVKDRVLRPLHAALVDEVDSVLIDDARTPLIISGDLPSDTSLYEQFADLVNTFEEGVHYDVDRAQEIVGPLDTGIEATEAHFGIDNLYDLDHVEHAALLQSALVAKALLKRDRDYLVNDGRVSIIDATTGRVLDGHRWGFGISQSVEAANNLPVSPETHTLATITYQNLFRSYPHLAGMTGTAATAADEFASVYNLLIVEVPTNRPITRIDADDQIYRTVTAKYAAIIRHVSEATAAGQPVLCGTASVRTSEELSAALDAADIAHQVLNAKAPAAEADVVAQAGRPGTVTVATNMAGRGVDILLGGDPVRLAATEIAAAGIADDSPEADTIRDQWTTGCADDAQAVRAAGGLVVIGTERHDSRRIDDQLRGRSGRQGDPGLSQFYLSLEDELLENFATDALSSVMSRLPDAVPLTAKVVTRATERAQADVEAINQKRREHVLSYDDVYDVQRTTIWRYRDDILTGASLGGRVQQWRDELAGILTENIGDGTEPETVLAWASEIWDPAITAEELTGLKPRAAAHLLSEDLRSAIRGRREEFGAERWETVSRRVALRVLDAAWRNHLTDLDWLKDAVQLRAAGQANPVVEWQREAFDAFETLQSTLRDDTLAALARAQLVATNEGGFVVDAGV